MKMKLLVVLHNFLVAVLGYNTIKTATECNACMDTIHYVCR